MKRRGACERLEDIRAAAQDALVFAGGLDEAAFSALPVMDRRTYRALKNALSEIGEAVNTAAARPHGAPPERGLARLGPTVTRELAQADPPVAKRSP